MSVFCVSVGMDAEGCVSMAMMAAGWLCVSERDRERETGRERMALPVVSRAGQEI